MSEISGRLNLMAEKLGLKRADIARAIRVTESSVSTMFSGKSNPSRQSLGLICDKFGVSEEWLTGGVGEMMDVKPDIVSDVARKHGLSEMETLIMRLVLELPEAVQKDFCEGLYDKFLKAEPEVPNQQTQPKKEEPWEREARLLEEEAAALRKGGRKCSDLPPAKDA